MAGPGYDMAEPVTPAGNGGGSSRRSKEDYDKVMARLSDQGFNPKRYPDPLVPRQGIDPQLYPAGVTLEMEKKWLARIQELREKGA